MRLVEHSYRMSEWVISGTSRPRIVLRESVQSRCFPGRRLPPACSTLQTARIFQFHYFFWRSSWLLIQSCHHKLTSNWQNGETCHSMEQKCVMEETQEIWFQMMRRVSRIHFVMTWSWTRVNEKELKAKSTGSCCYLLMTCLCKVQAQVPLHSLALSKVATSHHATDRNFSTGTFLRYLNFVLFDMIYITEEN